MFDVRLFPHFEAAAGSSMQDRQFLKELRAIRDATQARFVNCSILDYSRENPDSLHFLTYPADWVTHYLARYYTAIDPLLKIDLRRVSIIDWADLQVDPAAAELFLAMEEFGIGNNGASICAHIGGQHYCALHLVFGSNSGHWPEHKRRDADSWRFHADRVAEAYRRLHSGNARTIQKLTSRELEVLLLAALGKTDEQIAAQMNLGKWTVVGHLQSAKYKLGCVNRVSAVATAITSGLIDLKKTG
jgi:DNA-binding CsgD family transcriptional regulator